MAEIAAFDSWAASREILGSDKPDVSAAILLYMSALIYRG